LIDEWIIDSAMPVAEYPALAYIGRDVSKPPVVEKIDGGGVKDEFKIKVAASYIHIPRSGISSR
jgi:hypothetical protein